MAASIRPLLSDDLLERCAQRAAGYDRENRFFYEDFDELREAKYLLAAVPKEFGGLGLTLAEICQEQRRLARRSAPTALATNMHLLATGVAADLWRKGDKSQVWMLEEAARGAGNRLRVFGIGQRSRGGLRRRPGRAGRWRLSILWAQAFRLADAGLELAQDLRVRRRRPR